MKQKFLFISIFLFFTLDIVAQTPYLNTQKYNYLRKRFRDDFIVVDANNR